MRRFPWFLICVFAAIVFGTIGLFMYYYSTVFMDDMFISLRYAKNLVDGHGLAYNSGERFEGYSNFLYILLEAVGLRFSLDPFLTAKILSLFAALLFAGIFLFWAYRSTGSRRSVAVILALYLVIDPVFVSAANLGLETSLFLLTLISFFWTYWHRRERGSLWIVPAAVLFLTRPEGIIFIGLIWLADALVRRDIRSVWTRDHLGIFVVFLLYTGWRWEYYGSLLTGPALFKAANSNFFGDLRGLIEDKIKAAALFHWYFLVPLAGAAVFVWRHIRESNSFRAYLAASLAGGYAFTFFFHGILLTDYANYYRYHGQILPFVLWAFVWVLADASRIPRMRFLAAGVMIFALIFLPYRFWKLEMSLAAVRNRDQKYFEAAEFIRKLQCDTPDPLLSVHDAGIVPFQSGWRTLDWWLNDRRAAELIAKRDPLGWRDYILSRRPDVFFISNYGWSRRLLEPELQRSYSPIWTWPDPEHNIVILKRKDLSCVSAVIP